MFSTKKFKELRPKKTKIASMLGGQALIFINLQEQKLCSGVWLKCYSTMNIVEGLLLVTAALNRQRRLLFSNSAPMASNKLGTVRKSNFSELTSATRGCVAWHVARWADTLEASLSVNADLISLARMGAQDTFVDVCRE